MPFSGMLWQSEEGALGSPFRHAEMQEFFGSWLVFSCRERSVPAALCDYNDAGRVFIVKDEFFVTLAISWDLQANAYPDARPRG